MDSKGAGTNSGHSYSVGEQTTAGRQARHVNFTHPDRPAVRITL